MKIPTWPPRDWRAFLALAFSIGGAAVLTGLLGWTIRILERGAQMEAIANISYALLGIIGAVLLSLGLAINRRSIKFSKEGFEASGGDDAPMA
ncbi:MAG: hypothetical protein H0W74_13605 [Sphingosinicella sp.]|nr:hypothetical protein [Sphingosinicella sp.]